MGTASVGEVSDIREEDRCKVMRNFGSGLREMTTSCLIVATWSEVECPLVLRIHEVPLTKKDKKADSEVGRRSPGVGGAQDSKWEASRCH